MARKAQAAPKKAASKKKAEPAAPAKPRAPRKRRAATAAATAAPAAPARKQPEEIQPGRFYHYQDNGAHTVGELKSVDEGTGLHVVNPWSLGQPTNEVRTLKAADYDVREISRAEAHDISKIN